MQTHGYPEESGLIDAHECAVLCGISVYRWNKLAQAGRTPAPIWLGRRKLWKRDEVEDWIMHTFPLCMIMKLLPTC